VRLRARVALSRLYARRFNNLSASSGETVRHNQREEWGEFKLWQWLPVEALMRSFSHGEQNGPGYLTWIHACATALARTVFPSGDLLDA